jgi:adenylate kinase family enzyme
MLSINQHFQYIKENIIFSSKNIEYNLNDWINSTKNKKLLITGYTGSGKSTLSKNLSKKYNVKLIELDKYIKINEQYVDKLRKENKINKLHKYYQDTIDLHISKLLKSNEKLIIEGIQLFIYSNIKDFKNHSIIIIGTSALKSAIQAYNRNKNDNYFKEWNKLEIIKDIYYNLFIPKVEQFIKLIESWKK